MAKQNDSILCNFNEELILEKFFQFSLKTRGFLYRYLFVKEYVIIMLEHLVKYLIKVKKIKPYRCEKLIIRWCLIVVYYFYKEKYQYNLLIPEFDKLIEKGINIDTLSSLQIEDVDVYKALFNADFENNKEYNNNLNTFIDHLSEYKLERKDVYEINPNKVRKLLSKDNHFFTFKGVYPFYYEFKKYENNSSIDRIISDINSKDEPVAFEIKFTPLEFSNMLLNFDLEYEEKGVTKTIGAKKTRETIPAIFGYMIYNIIHTNDYSLKKPISLLTEEVLLGHVGQTTTKVNSKMFKARNEDNYFDKSKIHQVEFDFKYGEEYHHYILSKDGLLIK